jgi:hypothetical protein
MSIEVKRVEIRDRATFIPAVALCVTGGPFDRLLWRAGFGERPCVILIHLEGMRCNWDSFEWGNRTMGEAHRWLEAHWEEHLDGGVVDVEFVRGETAVPKRSELV